MGETEVYSIIRTEIIINHILMHIFTLVVVIALLIGVFLVEGRKTILSVFLPLLSLAWAAGMVRFDFFIHRQAAFLRVLETHISEKSGSTPLWETWKSSLTSTAFVIPIADLIVFAVIIIPTFYILFTSCAKFFESNNIKGGRLYVWSVSSILLLLLLSLAIIPVIF
jgi:hypothetical protein